MTFQPRLFFGLVFLLGISMVVISTTGCGPSEMERLRQKAMSAKANRTPPDDEEEPEPKPDKQAKLGGAEKVGSVADVKPAKSNLPANSSVARSAKSDDAEFVQFKTALLKKYEERKKNLTRVGKLEAVGRAFGEYVRTARSFPPRGIPYKSPTFSWRIGILKYLGYQELYDQFDFSSPFNSPLNKRLIELIPPEFQTIDGSTKTTLLAPVASFSAFWSDIPTMLNRLEDGIASTVAIVDVEPGKAVTWTRPQEIMIDTKDYLSGIRGRHDGFLIVIFGDGRVEKVNDSVSKKDFRAMLSYDAGDAFSSAILSPLEEGDFKARPVSNDAVAGKANGQPRVAKGDGSSNAKSDMGKPGPGGSFGGNFGSLPSAGNRTAVRLLEASQMAISAHRQSVAYDLRMASMLVNTDSDPLFSQFGWSKALQRPAFSLRWSIGVLLPDVKIDPDPVKRSVARKSFKKRPGYDTLDQKTGQIGLDAAIVLRKLVTDGLMGKYVFENIGMVEAEHLNARQKNSAPNKELSTDDALFDSKKIPDLNYSGVEISLGQSRSYHTQLAKDRGDDLLLLIDVETQKVQQKTMSLTTLRVIDVQRGRELMKSAPLNNLKIRKDREDALKEDIVFATLKKLDGYCRSEVALTRFPANLDRENILRRLKLLQEKPQKNKLPYLVEARMYLENNLILVDDYKAFCQKTLGDQAGENLVLGNSSERYDAIKKFVNETFLVSTH